MTRKTLMKSSVAVFTGRDVWVGANIQCEPARGDARPPRVAAKW